MSGILRNNNHTMRPFGSSSHNRIRHIHQQQSHTKTTAPSTTKKATMMTIDNNNNQPQRSMLLPSSSSSNKKLSKSVHFEIVADEPELQTTTTAAMDDEPTTTTKTTSDVPSYLRPRPRNPQAFELEALWEIKRAHPIRGDDDDDLLPELPLQTVSHLKLSQLVPLDDDGRYQLGQWP